MSTYERQARKEGRREGEEREAGVEVKEEGEVSKEGSECEENNCNVMKGR